MASWHRTRGGDLALRLGGGTLLGIAYVATTQLVRLQSIHPRGSPGWMEILLAATGFLSTSVGMMCVLLGRHLFDEVEVSERWRQRTDHTVPLDSVIRHDATQALRPETVNVDRDVRFREVHQDWRGLSRVPAARSYRQEPMTFSRGGSSWA